MEEHGFKNIEKKWQDEWEKAEIFEVKESKDKKKYYLLEMFPYPSASGLHMGHSFNYIIGDIYARFKRMREYNVLYPMGYDSLGLPAENAAIKEGINPKKYTEDAIANFIKQQKALGLSYDWTRRFETHDPEYYKWDQWIFLKMFEKGIAYRKKAPVNYCKKCETVLANEQVHDGKCWRHKETRVEIKNLEQWFFKITNYCNELYDGIDLLSGWPEDIKAMQKNWIGKSYGTEIDFEIVSDENKKSNCIIIHGCPSDIEKAMNPKRRTYDKHWIPWLKEKLSKNGIDTLAPLMPEPWKPDYESWKKEFDKLKVDENSILVGHSCGCAFLVRWLGETKKKIKKLILIAPWKIPDKNDEIRKKFYDYPIDDSIKTRVEEVIIFTSDDEKQDGKKSAKIFHESLGGEIIELKNRGHYTLEQMGTQEFPELLSKIISNEKWPVFTTRADTVYGVTFMVISAQHPKLMDIATKEQKKEIEKFLNKIKSTSEREMEELEKEGAFTGSYAVNPLTNEKIPVYVGNFVVAEYGSGMVMAVPAHDQRDFEFAKKYKIPIKVVIQAKDKKIKVNEMEEAYTEDGILVNSERFSDMDSAKARDEITKFLEKRKFGRKAIQYKLRDWLISRQRYWGTPIPIVYCNKCGIVAVPEKELPVKLPEKVKFGKGNPLSTNEDFVNTKCPKCRGNAKRETDTMDTFVNSSWYFLRYCDAHNRNEIFDKAKVRYWMPVDQYIGGKEHACMHLIYFRFYTKFLRDIGLLNFDEPAIKLFNQGMVHGSDGAVMSKSRGNVIDPLDMIGKFGADTLRFYLVSNASADKDFIWSEESIEGSFRFTRKVVNYFENVRIGKTKAIVESKFNKSVKEVTEDIENFRYNLALIKIRELFDYFSEEENEKILGGFLKLVTPFCPHIAEELWHKMGNKTFISLEKWPVADESKINPEIEKQEQEVENIIKDINNVIRLLKEKQNKETSKVFIYVLPKELETYSSFKGSIEKRLCKEITIFAVNDKKKYDPENKARKAEPNKPAIYLE